MESRVSPLLKPYLSLLIFIKSEDAGYNFVGDLREMVENVNKEVVDSEEFLSNNVYIYDRQMGKIKIV